MWRLLVLTAAVVFVVGISVQQTAGTVTFMEIFIREKWFSYNGTFTMPLDGSLYVAALVHLWGRGTSTGVEDCTWYDDTQVLFCDGQLRDSAVNGPGTGFGINVTQFNYLPPKIFDGLNISVIYMNNVGITDIADRAFNGTAGLKWLYLIDNNLSSLRYEMFAGLDDLQVLSLQNNKITHITAATDTVTYLPSLQMLNLLGNPLTIIDAGYFAPLKESPLHTLNLHGCNVQKLDSGTLSPLSELRCLGLGGNPKLMPGLVDILNGTKLEVLDLTNNMLSEIPTTALSLINDSLVALELNGNVLASIDCSAFPYMPVLRNLSLAKSGLLDIHSCAFDNMPSLLSLNLKENVLIQVPDLFSLSPPLALEELSLAKNPITELPAGSFSSLVNLRYLWLDNLQLNDLLNGAFVGLENLQSLSLSNSKLQIIGYGVFSSLANLRILILSGNSFALSLDLFNGLDSLEELSLRNNMISMEPSELEAFGNMTRLRSLDLSYNSITVLTAETFQMLESLVELDLSRNQIVSWDNSNIFVLNENLAVLFLAQNLLSSISDAMKTTFLRMKILDLSENSLICSCNAATLNIAAEEEKVKILHWDDGATYCIKTGYENNVVPLSSITEANLGCIPSSTLEIVLLSVGAFLCIICGVVYFKWWHIHYYYFIWKNSFRQLKQSENGEEYDYDAYVSSCEDDRAWVIDHLVLNMEREENGIRLCIPERDFEPGLSITENTVSCVDRSKKVIVVVSKSFVQNQWCQFETHIAQHRLLEMKRNTLVLVVLETVPKRARTKTLNYLMKTRRRFVWQHNDPEAQKLFWKKLESSIEKPAKILTFSHVT